MKKFAVVLTLALALSLATAGVLPNLAFAHCQIPCGIYGDQMRIEMMKEHITTIEKSMRLIDELSAGDPAANTNQIVRWVMNKEDHVGQFVEIVTAYWMQQRIKPVAEGEEGYDKYVAQVTLCHEMLVTAMKCKQTTDQANTAKLTELVDAFAATYFSEEDLAHLKEHAEN